MKALAPVIAIAALLAAGCGGSNTAVARYVDKNNREHPQQFDGICIDIASARQQGDLGVYYQQFLSDLKAADPNAPPADAVFKEIERRCQNPSG